MYFISIIITLIILFLFTVGGAGMQRAAYIIDYQSFLLPLLICIPILASCGLQKDFLRAFRLVSGKSREANLGQEKRSKEAVGLVMQTLLITGGLTAVYSLIIVLTDITNRRLSETNLPVMVAISLICLLYTLVLDLLLLPLYKKLQIMIMSHSGQI